MKKPCLLLLLAALCGLFAGCIQIPPLVAVERNVAEPRDDGHLRRRVDELERRVRELEDKSPRR